MFRVLPAFSLLFCIASWSYSLTGAEKDKILNVIAESTTAWNGRNLEKFSKFYTKNANFVNIFGERFIGRDQIKERHVKLHENPTAKLIIPQSDIDLSVIVPGVASAVMSWEIHYDSSAIGAIYGNWTWILVQFGDDWRIVSAHNTKRPVASTRTSKL